MTLRARTAQRGAALVIVLLLVATLSFVLLSITNIVTASVNRSAADRTRSDFLWKAAAAEEITRSILAEYLETKPAKMSPQEGIFREQIDMPFGDSRISIIFNDATRCFNVNDLATGGTANGPAIDNFERLAEELGLGGGKPRSLAETIADFIDEDFSPLPQGAEDNFYSALPTPFRTAGTNLGAVSELRALDGFSRKSYLLLRPYLCARDGATAPVNINFLTEAHAPLVYVLQGNPWTMPLDAVSTEIVALPPGGVTVVPPTFPVLIPPAAVTSALIQARIRLEVNDQTMEETLLFETTPKLKLVARSFGDGI